MMLSWAATPSFQWGGNLRNGRHGYGNMWRRRLQEEGGEPLNYLSRFKVRPVAPSFICVAFESATAASRSGDASTVHAEGIDAPRSEIQSPLFWSWKGIPMAFMFENLQVYQKSIDFADEIAGLTERFPRGFYFLVDQLNRAALSVVTNLAEGNGRFTKADRRNFFTLARGSA